MKPTMATTMRHPGEAERDLGRDRDARRLQDAEQDERVVTRRGEKALHSAAFLCVTTKCRVIEFR
jgi:hypothetical protein